MSDHTSTEPAILTAAEALEHWQSWVDAHTALQFATSYSKGDRTLTREDSGEIRRWINYWRRQHHELAQFEALEGDDMFMRPDVSVARFRGTIR